MLAADDYAFGLLDQPPVLQGGLELVGQPALAWAVELDGSRRI
jgi:hypothetical protein